MYTHLWVMSTISFSPYFCTLLSLGFLIWLARANLFESGLQTVLWGRVITYLRSVLDIYQLQVTKIYVGCQNVTLQQGLLISLGATILLLLNMLGGLFLRKSVKDHLLLIVLKSRSPGKCFFTLQRLFLQWWGVVMLLFLYIGDSAKLLVMGAPFNAVRWVWLVYMGAFAYVGACTLLTWL